MKRREFSKSVATFPLIDLPGYGNSKSSQYEQSEDDGIPCVACSTSIHGDTEPRRLLVDRGNPTPVEGEIWFCGECWEEHGRIWQSTNRMVNHRRELKHEITELRRQRRHLKRQRSRLERLNQILESYAADRSWSQATNWPPCPSCGTEVTWESFGVLRRPGPQPGTERFGWVIECPQCDFDEWRVSAPEHGKNSGVNTY